MESVIKKEMIEKPLDGLSIRLDVSGVGGGLEDMLTEIPK